jgi:hypothetical protein
MKKKIIIILILAGSVFQLLTVFRSGQKCDYGRCFWGPNGHDGVWHLALGRQAGQKIPPANPVYSGRDLKNYHWGYNLLLGLAWRILPVSITRIHFQIIPVIFALSLGLLSFKLAKAVSGSYWVGFWFTFLNYFSNSLGWVVSLIRNGKIGGESLFWSMQMPSFLLNPPFALSVLILVVGYYLWHKWADQLTWKRILIIGIIFGLLLNVKAYAAILFGLSAGISLLVKRDRFNLKNILVIGIAGVGYLLTWYLWHRQGSFPFIFKPLWFIRTMLEAKDRLYLPRFGHMWWTLHLDWLSSPRFWILAGGGTAAFIVGNFNLRLLGMKKLSNKFLEINFLLIILISIILPLLFVQNGTTWNTIQFIYYGLIFANYFMAKLMVEIGRSRKFLIIPIILITILGSWEVFKTYLTKNPAAYIPDQELAGLGHLEKLEGNNVLAYPYNPNLRNKLDPPYPLYIYESTAYVSAFTGKKEFASDRMNLDITGFDWEERIKEKKKFFESSDEIWARGFLLNNQIDYVYLVNDQDFNLPADKLGLKMIFDQEHVRIYQVLN